MYVLQQAKDHAKHALEPCLHVVMSFSTVLSIQGLMCGHKIASEVILQIRVMIVQDQDDFHPGLIQVNNFVELSRTPAFCLSRPSDKP